jgi:ribosomal protein S18 acetylase RimI-like enzyme
MAVSNDRIALRAAQVDDAERIARLHTDSWRRTYRGMMTDEFLDRDALDNRRGIWRERLGMPAVNQYVCIAQEGSEMIGFICAFADHDPVWGSYIDNLHVAYGSHRRGAGRALIRSAADWLCSVQCDRGVYLWVMEANAAARAFYERLGARNAGTIELEDPGGGHAPNCRYIWDRVDLLLSV